MDRLTLKVFYALTAVISILSVYSLVKHNSWSTAVFAWFVIQASVFWGFKHLPDTRRGVFRPKWLWAGFSIVAALTFVAVLRPPLTSIVVTVSDIPATSQLELKTVELRDDGRELIDNASHVHSSVNGQRERDDAEFTLIKPIKEEIQRLELRLGNHPYPWTLESITVGTDFARIPIPVATWTGSEIANTRFIKPLMTALSPNPSTGFSAMTTVRTEKGQMLRPALRLNLSRAIVVKQSGNSSYELIRAGWFLLFVASMFLAYWLPGILIVVKRIASKMPVSPLLRYLNSMPRPTPD